ncbi:MAG: asparagine synthase (glutamine-hydrolyzing) [Magnetospirillum sp.]|nr:asparagine synthase (glutamine-hydrolyzing) [Magnetospirillum sp.]
MCGICGFTGAHDRRLLQRMADAIVHRGPDDAGYWEGEGISLAMRRLSIVDLDGGQQPVFNEDGTIAVVFNGEIYNHPELREELQKKGHRFRTHHSDTEVLVHAYEEYGDDFLHKLNGMFAIALWDGRRRRLFLARDRMGIKPLYFSFAQGNLAFASEIKSLLPHPAVRRTPNFGALYHYFSFKNIPAPWSAYEGIEQLGPGERLIFAGTTLDRSFWWRFQMAEKASLSEEEAAPHIRDLLEDSVRLRMRADVPFGAYLSGGVDSSSVVALMSRLGAHNVKTFALVYEDDFKNKTADREYAKLVSDIYGTEHYEHVLTWNEVAKSLPDVLNAFDEPFSGVTSTFFLTALIARHVKVALSGDGADELFGSYLSHRLAQPLHNFAALSGRLDRLTAAERAFLAPYGDKLEYLRDIWRRGTETQRRASLYLWTDEAKATLLSDKMLALAKGQSTGELIHGLYDEAGTSDPLNRALFCDVKTLLPDQVLAFVDRLSMAHSVEVRPPFLDYRLVEFAASLPGGMKIKNGRNKHVLKEAVKDLLPANVIDRPKEGFVLPIDAWLLDKMRNLVETVLGEERLQSHGLLRVEAVKTILREHYSGAANHGSRIWNLMMFQLWWDRQFAH